MKQDRQQEGFMHLVHQHQGILHKISFIYGNNEDQRQDLRQEMVLQLWSSFPSFDERSLFSTWMYRVCLNTAISLARKPALNLSESPLPEIYEEPAFTEAFSDEIRMLYAAIAGLGKVDKAIILLWLEEKSYDEIAELIGITVKNVSVKLVRIRARLAREITKMH